MKVAFQRGARKMAAYHGDSQMAAVFSKIAHQSGIGLAIETGTFHGDTAAALAALFAQVLTCEIRADFVAAAVRALGPQCSNALVVHAHSREFLGWLLPRLSVPVMFFLDAHWQDDWPLADELALIAQYRKRLSLPVVTVVDDFLVPGRDNFQACSGGGGTIGDPIYGPRWQLDSTPCSMATFGHELASYRELWLPMYDVATAGYVVASDIALDLSPEMERLLA